MVERRFNHPISLARVVESNSVLDNRKSPQPGSQLHIGREPTVHISSQQKAPSSISGPQTPHPTADYAIHVQLPIPILPNPQTSRPDPYALHTPFGTPHALTPLLRNHSPHLPPTQFLTGLLRRPTLPATAPRPRPRSHPQSPSLLTSNHSFPLGAKRHPLTRYRLII